MVASLPRQPKHDCNHVQTLRWGLLWKAKCAFAYFNWILLQPNFESVKMKLTLPKWGLGSPPRLLKLQSSIAGVKTSCIGVFFISLESYQNVNVENGLAWAIWTFSTQVMAKRKVGSQIGNLTPDHKKLEIDPTPMCARGVRHIIGKLSRKATI